MQARFCIRSNLSTEEAAKISIAAATFYTTFCLYSLLEGDFSIFCSHWGLWRRWTPILEPLRTRLRHPSKQLAVQISMVNKMQSSSPCSRPPAVAFLFIYLLQWKVFSKPQICIVLRFQSMNNIFKNINPCLHSFIENMAAPFSPQPLRKIVWKLELICTTFSKNIGRNLVDINKPEAWHFVKLLVLQKHVVCSLTLLCEDIMHGSFPVVQDLIFLKRKEAS